MSNFVDKGHQIAKRLGYRAGSLQEMASAANTLGLTALADSLISNAEYLTIAAQDVRDLVTERVNADLATAQALTGATLTAALAKTSPDKPGTVGA